MIVLRMNLLLLASLISIMLLTDVIGYSITTPNTPYYSPEDSHPKHPHVHSHENHNETAEESHHSKSISSDYRRKREISENTVYGHGSATILETSCRQTLCASAPFYPSFAMSQAVNRVGKILRSNSQIDLEEKMLIDSMVIEYFPILQYVIYNYYLREPSGCDHYMNIFVPEEGYSANDNKIYYIVNVPSYHQRVESIICTNSGDVCNNDFVQSTCYQDFREEKLLVLPVDTDFNISDFRVKTFKVPNGCTCSAII